MPDGRGAARYRFGEFTLSPRRRVLLHAGAAVPLIPKYFDLLLLLVERRQDALDRREIFDRIWADVVVSESALSQAIRTLRRTLHDDPRTPRYIRTISRHGYQFVFEPVIVEGDEEGASVRQPPAPAIADAPREAADDYDALLGRVLGSGPHTHLSDDERRDAAEQLHALGTREALERLDEKAGHARARALLRDARWAVPGAGAVPLFGAPHPFASIAALIALRLRGAARAAASRLGGAAASGAIAGVLAGALGGAVLMMPDGSPATFSTMAAFVIIASAAGGFGAGGVGAGLAAAEALARSHRRIALAACGALSGMISGAIAHLAVRAVFGSVTGHSPAVLGGPIEGLAIGCAAGIGFGWSTHTPRGGGMATPQGSARLMAALITGACCAIAGAALAAAGAKTVAVTLDAVGETYRGSQIGLAPLARMVGEQDIRPVTRSLVSAFEGLFFGFGLAFGLTRRPISPPSR